MKLLIWLLDIVRLRLHRAIMKKNKSVSNCLLLMKTVWRKSRKKLFILIFTNEQFILHWKELLPHFPISMTGMASELSLKRKW